MRTWTNAAGGIRERYVPPPDQVCQALQVALPGIESFPTRRSVCADVDPLNSTNFQTANLLGVWITQGLTDPAHSVPYLLQGGLGMPDRDYYLSDRPQGQMRELWVALLLFFVAPGYYWFWHRRHCFDSKVAQLLATSLALEGKASNRLATIFNTIAPDEERKRRVLTVTRKLLSESDFGKSEQALIRQQKLPACHAGGRGFESRRSRQLMPVNSYM